MRQVVQSILKNDVMRVTKLNQVIGPSTSMSFGGVAPRSAFHSAIYAGADGAAAYAAAPPYPSTRPACGYYPYPPCY
jgi:hypothetical protein